MSINQQFKPILRQLRQKLIGDGWRESIRPIAWYNLPFWIWETVAEDFKFYQSSDRPLDGALLKRLWSPNLDSPIFIVGAPRSGTTFLGECLGTCPQIGYHFEPILTKAATRYVYQQLWSEKFARWFYRSVYGWLMRLHLDADLRFAEKTPQISLIIPFLHQTFPNARFVHIIRDGRDAAVSLAKKPWYSQNMNGSGAKEPDGYPFGSKARFWVEAERTEEYEQTDDLHRCLWLWRRYVETILQSKLQLPSHQYHELRYEALVQNPVEEAEKLMDFIELTQPKLRSNLQETFAKRANPTSIGNWRSALTTKQLDRIQPEAATLLKQLDYSV